MRLDGKTAVVTGGSSGLGLALAVELARRGVALTLAARDGERLDAARERVAAAVPGAPAPYVVSCDVRERSQVRRLVEAAVGRWGRVDLLVNNAGISVYGPTHRTSEADLRRMLDVNLVGPFHAMLEVLPHMREQGDGLIVNVASLAALYGVPYLSAYGASKAALAALGQSLRAELAGSGVRVLTVYPGYLRTALFEREKKLGGARRPDTPYATPERVAIAVARAIERDQTELVLTAEGRVMSLLRRVAPRGLDLALRGLALRLRQTEVQGHG